MRIVQINEDDYVSYQLAKEGRAILATVYSGEQYVGAVQFNMKEEIPESDLEHFTIREASALFEFLQDE